MDIKYGTKQVIYEATEGDNELAHGWTLKLDCLCGNKMRGRYASKCDIPQDSTCEKCGNFIFDDKFKKVGKYTAPCFHVDFKNNRGFGVTRKNISMEIDYNNEDKEVKKINVLRENMGRKIVFDIVDGTLVCYKNGIIEYDYKKEDEMTSLERVELLNKINSFLMRNISVKQFIDVVGTEQSKVFYKYIDENYESFRTNKKIISRLRVALNEKDEIKFSQILTNAGLKNVTQISKASIWSRRYSESKDYSPITSINKNGKNPAQILNIPKSIVPKFIKITQNDDLGYKSKNMLTSLWRFFNDKKGKYDINIINMALSMVDDEDAHIIIERIDSIYSLLSSPKYKNNKKRILEYMINDLPLYQGITSFSNGLTLLKDYQNMVERMGGVPEKYPKSLKRSHDIAMVNYNKWQSNLTEEDFIIATKKYSHLQDINKRKKYSFLVPNSIKDLIGEGNHLNHCIASYDRAVMNGRSKIIFMRDNEDIGSPLVSIEIKQDRINQARGSSNRDVTDSEREAIQEWAEKNDIIY